MVLKENKGNIREEIETLEIFLMTDSQGFRALGRTVKSSLIRAYIKLHGIRIQVISNNLKILGFLHTKMYPKSLLESMWS